MTLHRIGYPSYASRPLPRIGGDQPVKFVVGSANWDDTIADTIARPLEAIAFWSAIALPFLYIPLLIYGLNTAGQVAVFLGLVVLNVIAFVLGHGYNRQ